MLSCFFKKKQEQAPEQNNFSLHLPAELYRYLQNKNLLDINDENGETPHEFSYANGIGVARITVEYHLAKLREVAAPGQVIIRISRTENNKWGADLYIFHNHFFYCARYRKQMSDSFEQQEGIPYEFSEGSIKKTQKQTPEQVAVLIKRLEYFMGDCKVSAKRAKVR